MGYPIEKKLVITLATSALFDLTESHKIYREQGVELYRKYQDDNIDVCFEKGVAFPFIKRLLSLNEAFPDESPVEVVLLSRNSPETGMRAFRSIQKYNLNISRAGFLSGSSPSKYLPSLNSSLFLSAEEKDVRNAVDNNHAAGRVLNTIVIDDESDLELRIAFDFDGVLANDESEKIYQENQDVKQFQQYEVLHSNEPLLPGLLQDLLMKISFFQKIERRKQKQDSNYKKILRTYIVTARNAPAHERLINTLKSWDIEIDEAFFLGGIDKSRILDTIKPHIYFDDQISHLKNVNNVPLVHIPFGIINKKI